MSDYLNIARRMFTHADNGAATAAATIAIAEQLTKIADMTVGHKAAGVPESDAPMDVFQEQARRRRNAAPGGEQ